MNARFILNVLIKGLILFILINIAWIGVRPESLGKVSIYNTVIPGRQRFPFGEDSSRSYNLSLYNIDAMFASHVISAPANTGNELRVFLIGDSSTWGTLLRPGETLAGGLNSTLEQTCGRDIQVYNLGYPTISLTKDLMILDYALRYHPDLVIWMVTLEAFPMEKQLTSPIVVNNADRVKSLLAQYHLEIPGSEQVFKNPGILDRTIIGQRRALADQVRLQLYGVMWAATGIDQSYPLDYQPAQIDFSADASFHGRFPPTLEEKGLAFNILEAGIHNSARVPILIVNEPILVSSGENSDLRYNFFYPRWAYDQWRTMMSTHATQEQWDYLDLWNIIPAGEFTNSAIHLTPAGEMSLAGSIAETLRSKVCR